MKMTHQQAEALGIVPRKKTRTTRRTAKGPYHTVCTTCDEQFHTIASEDRHLEETKHRNYRIVMGWTS
jgi:hypothetical protein